MKDSTLVTTVDVYMDDIPSTSDGKTARMFTQFRSQSHGGRKNFGKPKKESNTKKQHMKQWIRSNKKVEQQSNKRGPVALGGVIMSGDSAPPLQSSIPSAGYDLPDEMRPGKIISTSSLEDEESKPMTNGNANNAAAAGVTLTEETIEESATPVAAKPLPMLEENNKIESNGYDHTDSGKLVDEPDDDSCLVQCVYITQQCCECTIS